MEYLSELLKKNSLFQLLLLAAWDFCYIVMYALFCNPY